MTAIIIAATIVNVSNVASMLYFRQTMDCYVDEYKSSLFIKKKKLKK